MGENLSFGCNHCAAVSQAGRQVRRLEVFGEDVTSSVAADKKGCFFPQLIVDLRAFHALCIYYLFTIYVPSSCLPCPKTAIQVV
jgi:hypothetical protein